MNLTDSVLACPKCGGWLYTMNQGLWCERCNLDYPTKDGIPRFVESDAYSSAFSYEWARHARTMLDSVSGLRVTEVSFFRKTGLTPDEINGKLVLDAGCGMGRYSEIAAKYGGSVVGLDLSYSVEAAAKNVPAASFVQGDILCPPFRAGVFDIVFSLGVIHHTPDAAQAFRSLARLVKLGGKLAVWVYGKQGNFARVYNTSSTAYRTLTTRMPKAMLYRLCKAANSLYPLEKRFYWLNALVPLSMEPNPEWRALSTFDWYSPKYQSKHTAPEVSDWFKQAGFRSYRSLDFPVSCVGVR